MEFNELKYFYQQEDEINEINKAGIEANRKGNLTISVLDKDGTPVAGGTLKIKQDTHDFMFGANSYMLDSFKTDKENQMYKEDWLKLFNTAVVPFYWLWLEPEKGKPRYSKDCDFVYRKPPIELVMEFCRENNIRTKGHTLTYHKFIPDWVLKTGEGMWDQMVERYKDIAKRYNGEIKMWDIVNEALIDIQVDKGFTMPKDYVYRSVKLAEELFRGSQLLLNEDTPTAWNPQKWNCAYSLMLENMRLRDARFDGIGMQYHLFFRQEDLANQAEIYLNPKSLIETMDMYSRFGVPLQISEITIPSYRVGDRRALELQNELCERLYTLWFAHSNVEAIIWWNLVTGGEYSTRFWDEGYFDGSLVNKDFTKKPAYHTLDNLINKEWKTNLEIENSGENEIRGFFGEYTVEFTKNGYSKTEKVHLKKGAYNNLVIEL